jgi:hypothetical protein
MAALHYLCTAAPHWVRLAQHVQLQLSCAAGSACTHWPPTMLQMLASQSQLNHHNSPLEPQHQVGGRWPNRQGACAAEELKLPGACKGWQNTCWRPGADSRACGRCPQGISACSSSVSSELLSSTYRCKRGIKTHWQGFCSPLCAWFPCALPKQAKYPAAECASTGKQQPAHWQWPARRASAAATRQGTGTKLLHPADSIATTIGQGKLNDCGHHYCSMAPTHASCGASSQPRDIAAVIPP